MLTFLRYKQFGTKLRFIFLTSKIFQILDQLQIKPKIRNSVKPVIAVVSI